MSDKNHWAAVSAAAMCHAEHGAMSYQPREDCQCPGCALRRALPALVDDLLRWGAQVDWSGYEWGAGPDPDQGEPLRRAAAALEEKANA